MSAQYAWCSNLAYEKRIQFSVWWATRHAHGVNISKTWAIVFGSSFNLKYISSLNLPPLTMSGQIVKFVNKAKSLGVVLSSDLSWNAHVSSVSSKVNGVLHKLRTRGWLLPCSTKKMLVQALVYPHLGYACLVFKKLPAYLLPAYLCLKMQRLANVGIRFIFNLCRDTSITLYRRELGWSTLVTRRAYFLSSTAY